MNQEAPKCPFHEHYEPIGKNGRGSKYPDYLEETSNVINNEAAPMIARVVKTMFEAGTMNTIGNIITEWEKLITKEICQRLDIKTKPHNTLADEIDELYTELHKTNGTAYTDIPVGWRIVIGEGGIMDATGYNIKQVVSSVSYTRITDLRDTEAINELVSSKIDNIPFAKDSNGVEEKLIVVCRAKPQLQSIFTSVAFNYCLVKLGIDEYIDPLDSSGVRKNRRELFHEYQEIIAKHQD